MVSSLLNHTPLGSDVSGLVTTATVQGDNYVLSGGKKYITNGTYAGLLKRTKTTTTTTFIQNSNVHPRRAIDYFVTAVRTGGGENSLFLSFSTLIPTQAGHGGLSFVLIERDAPGFSVRKVTVRGATSGGTAYLDFANAITPRSNLIGKEGEGFTLITHNFNHERWYVSVIACRLARVCLEESIKYASRRMAFGKPLGAQQSIRMKIANMAREVEMFSAWLEAVTYQIKVIPPKEAPARLGEVIALLKAQCSILYEKVARETTMIFGGNALFVDGPGRKIEGAVSSVKAYQIPAGAEDVMLDFVGKSVFRRISRGQAKL